MKDLTDANVWVTHRNTTGGEETMKLGCNLSSELIELIQAKEVELDYVKIALESVYDDIPFKYSTYGDVLLHGLGHDVQQHTGAELNPSVDWVRVNKQVDYCGSPHIGLHCATYWSDWACREVTYDMVKERMSSNIRHWQSHMNGSLVIENVPYTPYYEIKPGVITYSVSPRLITELCVENEVGLLLDLAHAKVTAHGTNTELREYLSLLPLSLVRELHVVGTRSQDDGTLRDHHLEMDSDDYNILEWILDRTSPMVITLEYGGFGDHFSWRSSKSAIKRQLEAISSILGERKKKRMHI